MAASAKLISWHKDNCSGIDIDSEEFTYFLLEEISKLKEELQGG